MDPLQCRCHKYLYLRKSTTRLDKRPPPGVHYWLNFSQGTQQAWKTDGIVSNVHGKNMRKVIPFLKSGKRDPACQAQMNKPFKTVLHLYN